MSQVTEIPVTCPGCGHQQTLQVWSVINTDADASLRERLFAAQINRLHCEACEKDAFLSTPLLYHDRTREFCVQYLPEQVLEDISSLQGYTTSGKADVQIPSTPSGTHYLAEPHVVFDINEMLRYIRFRELLFARDRSQSPEP